MSSMFLFGKSTWNLVAHVCMPREFWRKDKKTDLGLGTRSLRRMEKRTQSEGQQNAQSRRRFLDIIIDIVSDIQSIQLQYGFWTGPSPNGGTTSPSLASLSQEGRGERRKRRHRDGKRTWEVKWFEPKHLGRSVLVQRKMLKTLSQANGNLWVCYIVRLDTWTCFSFRQW